MHDSIFARLRYLAGAIGGMALLLLAIIVARWPLAVLIAAAGTTLLLSFMLLRELGQLQKRVDASSSHIGQFIRGSLDARILDIGPLDALGRMQHRINNLFDILDATIRREDAALGTGDDDDYLQKIRQSGLYDKLHRRMTPPVVEAEPLPSLPPAAPAPDMLPFLKALAGIQQRAEQLQQSIQRASGKLSAPVAATSAAATAEQLSLGIHSIAGQASEAGGVAAQAVQHARKSDGAIQSLRDASGKIGEVVELIHSIAGQTNLLALNATIEAARAGEAGRGFAVVAGEVKTLAGETRRATDEISRQVGDIQNHTQEAVAAIGEIGQMIARMEGIASAMARAVEEQRLATQAISSQLQEPPAAPHAALEEMHATLQMVTTMLEETAMLNHEVTQLHEAA